MTRFTIPAISLMRRRRVVAGLAFAALCVPVAGAGAYNAPSDANGATVSSPSSGYQLPSQFRSENASNSSPSDIRSNGALPSTFRSEATDGYAQQPAPETVAVQQVHDSGFDWGDAGIGAATIVGLLALGGGMTLLVSHHRRRTPGSTAVAS